MAAPDFADMSPDQQDRIGRVILRESFETIERVGKELDGWTTMDGTSRLAEDNAATSLYRPMSHDLHYLMSSARDHLDLINSLWGGGEMPPFAPFTLIRSALESCAYGIWIQSGGTLATRILRLLQLQWSQRLNVDRYTTAAGVHRPELTKWLSDVLNDTKDRRGPLRERSIEALPSITDTLTVTEKSVNTARGMNGLAAWRVGSGITHGNQHFASGLMDRRPTELADGSEGSEHTISIFSLAIVLSPAATYFSSLMKVLMDNSVAQPGRPVAVAITGGPPPPIIPGVND